MINEIIECSKYINHPTSSLEEQKRVSLRKVSLEANLSNIIGHEYGNLGENVSLTSKMMEVRTCSNEELNASC